MPDVWRIPELATHIIGFLPDTDAKRVLQCCRRDFELAVGRAWETTETQDLHKLLKVLSIATNKDHALERLRMYMRLIKTLDLYWETYQDEADECIRLLHGWLLETVEFPLLPSLRSLQISLASQERMEVATMLIQPTLQSFTIDDQTIFCKLPWLAMGYPRGYPSELWESPSFKALNGRLAFTSNLTEFKCLEGYAYFDDDEMFHSTFANLPSLTAIHFRALLGRKTKLLPS
ncbi:hypothetical protein DACRYDRAFT_19250 [Dacryopinax primogenitus]|uniref:F-box domain-containing protein n=1 Tax=Dacryopinax primogenitus (strain DJM 731) TaxID=1858805 RepID=M5FN04_DACPD|nr:uncharacterized protein DACRYDRAFT_19250 [Dacryopinax primogenitus]EJT96600.1 hypothetical protein DACRYDRAFT_19250 [Dacryopinax primogenitus]